MAIVLRYLGTLAVLEMAIPRSADNLDTDTAAVWTTERDDRAIVSGYLTTGDGVFVDFLAFLQGLLLYDCRNYIGGLTWTSLVSRTVFVGA